MSIGTAICVGVAGLLSLPVLIIALSVFQPSGDTWRHLIDTVLADYVSNSLLLMLGVALATLVIGISSAWLTVNCRFPGSGFFEWALLLPLAIPAYIIAYTYTGMLDFAGPVQSALRAYFNWGRGDYWFPAIRSLGGAVSMLSLVLYPYVYLLSRSAFLEQSASSVDAARTLGCSDVEIFLRVTLPAARPAIIAGLSLALMETLADFGTVDYFGLQVFSTGIFRTWFGLGDEVAAAQLSAVLLIFVLSLILIERWSRRKARYTQVDSRSRPIRVRVLQGRRALAASLICALPLLLGFVIPSAQLLVWAVRSANEMLDAEFFYLVFNSLALAGGAAILAVNLALLIVYTRRINPRPSVVVANRLVGMGYAIPGTVIAVGVIIPFAWLDNSLNTWLQANFNVSPGLIFSGTLFTLMFAYMVRFLAVSLQTLEAGLGKITCGMDDAGRILGCTANQVLWRVHEPMLRGALLTAALLVFVDVMKELPATLVLRPFNFNTLAVRAYELASDERLEDSASAALAIVLSGLIPVIILSLSIARSRRRDARAPVSDGQREMVAVKA